MKLPFWGTIFTILGVCVLCALGYWQVQRYVWKQEILSALAAEYDVNAADVALDFHDFSDYSGYKRGYFEGRYLHAKTILLQPRIHEGTPGYHALTPFEIAGGDGVSILVDRGWIPIEYERSDYFLMDMPPGRIKVTGMLRKPPKPNPFTPENDPDRGVWYRVDINKIAQFHRADILPRVMFYAETEGARRSDYPVSASTQIQLSNNHAQYALFWFAMASAMVGIYVLRFFRGA